MDEVHFENQGEEFGAPPERSGSDLTSRLIRWGVVSNREQAQYVMIGVAVVVFIIAFLVFRSATS